MRDLLEEYQRTGEALRRRLEELHGQRGRTRGEAALLLEKRIQALEFELDETARVIWEISKYLEVGK